MNRDFLLWAAIIFAAGWVGGSVSPSLEFGLKSFLIISLGVFFIFKDKKDI